MQVLKRPIFSQTVSDCSIRFDSKLMSLISYAKDTIRLSFRASFCTGRLGLPDLVPHL